MQDTWLRLMRGIGGVREPHALGGWLTTTARRESLRMRERGSHELPPRTTSAAPRRRATRPKRTSTPRPAARPSPARWTRSPRHRDLMRALFDEAAGSYHDIARDLGIPVGSIGPIRGRCLEQCAATRICGWWPRRSTSASGGRRSGAARCVVSGRDVEPELPRA